MKLFHGFTAASLLLLSSACVSRSATVNHWSAKSIGPSISHAFLGYDGLHGESYLDFQWDEKVETHRTVMRHFLNSNPDNPFKSSGASGSQQRPNNSLSPNPVTYIDFTLFGGVIGTLSEGGMTEFLAGFGEVLEPLSVIVSGLVYGALPFENLEAQGSSQAAERAISAY